MEKEKVKKIEVKLQPLNIKVLSVEIVGKTPLLMDKRSDDTLKEILDKQKGVSKSAKKKVRDLKSETELAIHKTSKGTIGFPAHGFKAGMINAAARVGDKFFSKVLIRGSIRIINQEEGLIPITYGKQDILEHNIGTNTKMTPQFHNWACKLIIKYDGNNISASDILTLINYAGFYNGIGMWRPTGSDGGSGEYGCYEVKA